MRAAITGATGLLGSNLAIQLLEQGHDVVATKRKSSKIAHLDPFPIEWREATLSQIDALAAAFEGADVVFHCAAAVSIRFEITDWIVEANVKGTDNVLSALRQAGVPRLLHCSTVGTIGISTDGEPVDESAPWNFADFGLNDAYVTTKKQAEELVLEEVAAGLDAVIVNPGYMLGPYDARPSSGQVIVDLVKGRVPFYTMGTNSFVDVRDVARGMIAAAERGETGERYILAGHNMLYRDAMRMICSLGGGASAPRFEAPKLAAKAIGAMGDLWGRMSGKDPLLTSSVVAFSQCDRYLFDSSKAQQKLAYEISPVEPAIEDAVKWFRDNGYI